MKNIKKFESFVNERLSDSTYTSAANKFREIGQYKTSRELIKHRDSKYKVYEFDIMRTWEQSFVEDENGETDTEFDAHTPESLASGYTYGGYDNPDVNLLLIFLNNEENNVGTMISLEVKGGKLLPAEGNVNACWMSNRRSAADLIKILRIMDDEGKLSDFLADSDNVSLDGLEINPRDFIKN